MQAKYEVYATEVGKPIILNTGGLVVTGATCDVFVKLDKPDTVLKTVSATVQVNGVSVLIATLADTFPIAGRYAIQIFATYPNGDTRYSDWGYIDVGPILGP